MEFTSPGNAFENSVNVLKPYFRKEEILSLISDCLDKGWTGLGNKTVEFEESWKLYSSIPNAHFLASNTVGLHLALEIPRRIYSWPAGSEVITTPLTFVSTNHAIIQSGLNPVFADVDASLCLSPESVLANITDRTRALIFVGIGGNLGKYEEIARICNERGIWLILDAAHMAGSYDSDGQHVGRHCDVSVFSFQAVKNLPTADSGMICFKQKEHDLYCRKLSWLGISKDTFERSSSKGAYKWDYDVEEIGYKYHGNSIMASIGLVSLKYLDIDNGHRRSLYEVYKSKLSSLGGTQLIGHQNCTSSRHLVQCIVPCRDQIIMGLHEYGIYPGVHYKDNTLYKPYRYAHGTCPNAHFLSSHLLSLPCHLGLTFNDAKKVSDILVYLVNRVAPDPDYIEKLSLILEDRSDIQKN